VQNTKLTAALQLAKQGHKVFPLVPDGKTPLLSGSWREHACDNPEQIKQWWGANPNANIGMTMEKLVALDIDPRNGGDQSLQLLTMLYDMPRTRRHVTWSSGAHILYRQPEGVQIGCPKNHGLGAGIDVKGLGGYLVAPGSTIDGKPYWVANPDREFAELPQDLVALCGQFTAKSESAGKRLVEEDNVAITLAGYWIQLHAPEAVEGQRDNTAYQVAAKLYDFGVSRDTCREMLSEWSYAKCFPPMEDHDIERVARSGETNRDKAIGCAHPAAPGFEPMEIQIKEGGSSESESPKSNIPIDLVLSLEDWAARDLPEPQFISGSWLTTTSRVLVVAPTGLGKSMLLMALGMAVAAGKPFLHWSERPPVRVLYIDGEMSRRLLKRRLADECRRLGVAPPTFFALSHEDIPNFKPLNTPEGRAAIEAVVKAIGGVDLIIFDNIMSLVAGDQKEEEGWSQTIPWVKALTARGIGQVWVHHTGHDESRSYGTKTREWQLDTVVHLTRATRPETDVSFDLEFRKARERTPETRQEFAERQVRLVMDQWVHEASSKVNGLAPQEQIMFQILAAAGPDGLTTEEWHARARVEGIGVKRKATLTDIKLRLRLRSLVRNEGERWFDLTTVKNDEDGG
jgi:hypothetical protein